jgi:hypothetical protein
MSSTLAKSLPKSSTLYVISKGKVQHIRPTGPPFPPHDENSTHVPQTKSIRDIVTLLQNDQLRQPNKLFAHTPNCEDLNRYDTNYMFFFCWLKSTFGPPNFEKNKVLVSLS